MKKVLICSLVAMIAIIITACVKGTSAANQNNQSLKVEAPVVETADTSTLKTDPIPGGGFLLKMKVGQIFYVENTTEKSEIGIANPSTGEVKTISIPDFEENNLMDYAVTVDGTIWVLTVPIKNGSQSTVYQFNLDGNQQSSFVVDGLASAIAADETQTIYLAFENGLTKETNKVHVLTPEGEMKAMHDIGYYPSFFEANDHSIYVKSMVDDVETIEKLEPDGTFSPAQFQNVGDDIKGCQVIDGGNEFAFFMLGDDGISGYNSSTNQLTPLLSYDELEASPEYLQTVFSLEQGQLCIVTNNEDYTKLNFKLYTI